MAISSKMWLKKSIANGPVVHMDEHAYSSTPGMVDVQRVVEDVEMNVMGPSHAVRTTSVTALPYC